MSSGRPQFRERIDQTRKVGLVEPLGPLRDQAIGQLAVADRVEQVASVPERDLALVQQQFSFWNVYEGSGGGA